MSLRLDVEPGGEYLLPYAKKKLEEMKREARSRSQQQTTKVIQVDTGTQIVLQANQLNNPISVDNIRIIGSGAGWNAFSDTSSEVHTYVAAKVTKTLSAPAYTRASSVFPFADSSGLVVYRSAGNTVAHYLHGSKLTPIVIYDPADTGKTNPLFPRTGTTVSTIEIRFIAGKIFISALMNVSGQQTVYIANANTQQLISSVPATTSVIQHFTVASSTEGWTLVNTLAVPQTTVMVSTLGTQISYTMPVTIPGNAASVSAIGIVNGTPVILLNVVVTAAPGAGVSQLFVSTGADTTSIFTGQPGTPGFAGEQINTVAAAAFAATSGDYYEVIFPAVHATNGTRSMYTYSSQTGLVRQYTDTISGALNAFTSANTKTQSKDQYLSNAFVHAGHLYMPIALFNNSAVTNSFYLLSISGARLGLIYGGINAFNGYVACFRGNTESGYVLALPDGSIQIITPTRTTLVDQVPGPGFNTTLQDGGIVSTKGDVYFAYFWLGTVGSNSYRRIYKLLTGGVIDLGAFITASNPTPFMGGVLTSGKPYFYAKTHTVAGAEVIATIAGEFANLSVIDGTGQITLVEALPRTAVVTALQPPDFEKQIATWNAS